MISPKVMSELLQAKHVPTQFTVPKPGEHAWSLAEQRRFWEALQHFPQGPWTAIANHVGSKSTRQAMTHAQKLRQKLSRWKRRVRSESIGSVSPDFSAPILTTTPGRRPINRIESQWLPRSTRKRGKIAEFCIVNRNEEEDMRMSICDSTNSKANNERKLQHLDNHTQVLHAPDDRYLEHLLIDIEPVLEHVAYFTKDSQSAGTVSQPLATTGNASEQPTHVVPHAVRVQSKHVAYDHTCDQRGASNHAKPILPTQSDDQHVILYRL
ncbi:hypothetical protein CCR75_001137 [Bremia lactucae]|uniref:Myb-like domain-containing protein n=1 Tax=Bremia lactucae TaxID=4779 RepID=A0A976FQT6_BRELC|nr:hypothetical protein CCR75_001137 [Bremia lactucae]